MSTTVPGLPADHLLHETSTVTDVHTDVHTRVHPRTHP